jgi:hypothetical protein
MKPKARPKLPNFGGGMPGLGGGGGMGGGMPPY